MFICEVCGCAFGGDWSPVCDKQTCYDAFMQHACTDEENWGPEDGGCCPCNSPSCDGTCAKQQGELL